MKVSYGTVLGGFLLLPACKPPPSTTLLTVRSSSYVATQPLPILAVSVTAVFHHIFGTFFRSWQSSQAPFPIKIPFHKTAFTNSLSGLKSSDLSSLVHCFHSLLSWNPKALLICDLFHPDRLRPAAVSQQVFPCWPAENCKPLSTAAYASHHWNKKPLFIPETSGMGYTVQLPPKRNPRTEFLLLLDVYASLSCVPCCMQGPNARYQFCNQTPGLQASSSPRSQEPAQTFQLRTVPHSYKP